MMVIVAIKYTNFCSWIQRAYPMVVVSTSSCPTQWPQTTRRVVYRTHVFNVCILRHCFLPQITVFLHCPESAISLKSTRVGQILPTREAWQEYVNAQKRAKWIAICFQPKDFLGCISSFVENINHLWICTKPLLYMHPWSGQHKAWNASGTITCEPHVRRMAKSHKCRVAKQAARYLNDCAVVPLLL